MIYSDSSALWETVGVGIIAVDPDSHYTSLVGLNPQGEISMMAQTSVPNEVKGGDCLTTLLAQLDLLRTLIVRPKHKVICLVESQQMVKGLRNADSLLMLSKVSGAVGLMLYDMAPYGIQFILPRSWKGSVPKEAFTKRIVNHSGLPATKRGRNYALDWGASFEWATDLSPQKQGHLIDAYGLAKWGLRQSFQ